MRRNLLVAVRFTLITTVVFGLLYPLAVTMFSQWIFPHQANGSLVMMKGNQPEQSVVPPHPRTCGGNHDVTHLTGLMAYGSVERSVIRSH